MHTHTKSYTKLGTVAFCALLWTAAASAQPPQKGRSQAREARMEEIHRRLGLTPEQSQKLKDHRKSHKEEARRIHEQLREKRQALKEELEKPDYNPERIKQMHGEMKDLRNKKDDLRLNGILEVRKILTPDQFKKFHELTHDKRKGKERRWEKPAE
jgi:Spy/CpxP family protein refolding chaperone